MSRMTVKPLKRKRGPKASYHYGNLKPAVIQLALKLLEKHGTKLSLRLIARELGVSQTAPYHHFADKNALFAALATEGFRKLASNVQQSPLQKYGLERRIAGLCGGLVGFARANPELFRLMYDVNLEGKDTHLELIEAASISYRTLVTRIKETFDEFAIRHLDVDYAAMAIWTLGYGMARFVLDKRISPEAVQVIGDGHRFVREVSSILAGGFAPERKATALQPGGFRKAGETSAI